MGPASWAPTCASGCSADGDEVIALDNFLTGTPANVEHLLEHDGFRLVQADVTEYVHVPGPVDQVLHFASPASPIDYLELPIETLKVGSIGTLHALGLAKEKGARFLLASTSETYGDPQVHPQPETYWGHVNPVGPRGVYDEAKRFAEALTMAYRRTHGVDTAIVRIFNTYGPRMRPNDGRAIPTFVTPGADRRADHGRRRRQPDPLDLLRRRPRRGHPRAAAQRPRGPGQHRQPARDVGADLAETIKALTGSEQRDRVHRPPGRRPDGPPARHHPGPHRARLGAGGRLRGRARAHARVVRRPPRRSLGAGA